MSGFRCGVLHSRNKEVYRAICDGYAGFHNVPTPTQACQVVSAFLVNECSQQRPA